MDVVEGHIGIPSQPMSSADHVSILVVEKVGKEVVYCLKKVGDTIQLRDHVRATLP